MVDHHLVEADRPGHRSLAAAEDDLQDGPLLDPVVTIEIALEPRLELVRFHLGQKAKATEVDAEDGNCPGGGEPGAGEKRAVAAERHDQGAAFEVVRDRCLGAITVHVKSFDTSILQGGDGAGDHRQLGARPAQNANGHFGIRRRKNSWLPCAPVTSDATSPVTS